MPPCLSEILNSLKLSLRFIYKLGQKIGLKIWTFFFSALEKELYLYCYRNNV